MVAECRKVPHVKNALFEYTKHEVRAFLRYVRNAHGLEEGADITFGVLSKVGVRVRARAWVLGLGLELGPGPGLGLGLGLG